MLLFSGKKYAKNDTEFVDSLFQDGGTCAGYYQRISNGIRLMTIKKEYFAFLVSNKHGERFIVSMGSKDGKPYYMHGLNEQDAIYLGVSGMKSSVIDGEIDAAMRCKD